VTYIQAILLGILQGVTEFFPVSSSGHLVLVQKLLGINGNVLTFDIYVHFGTLLAVLMVFRRSIINLISSCFDGLKLIFINRISFGEVYKSSHEIRVVSGILIGTLPAVFVGLAMENFIKSLFHSTVSVFAALLFTGCILIFTFFVREKQRHIGSVYGFIVGLAQALAIIPGVSRSGLTISMALFLGVKRKEAGEFSFLLSIPVILGATILALNDYIEAGFSTLPWDVAIIGTLVSFVSGWISLVLLMRIIKYGEIGYFGFYCIVVSVAGALISFF